MEISATKSEVRFNLAMSVREAVLIRYLLEKVDSSDGLNDAAVADANRMASALHLVIQRETADYTIYDQGLSND